MPPAKPGFPRHSQVSEGDLCDHTSLSGHVNAIMSHASFHPVGCVLHEACGGAPCTSESGSPCGSPSRPIVSESDACCPSPPCQPSSTLRRGGLGTNGNILHVASGGYHSDAFSDDPCGLKGLRPDREHDACRLDPRVEPASSCLGLPCSVSYIMHVASGGSSLPPFHEFDGFLQTLPQPLSPPLPSIAAIHDHGHVSALLRVSVSRVNSTPLHPWPRGAWWNRSAQQQHTRKKWQQPIARRRPSRSNGAERNEERRSIVPPLVTPEPPH